MGEGYKPQPVKPGMKLGRYFVAQELGAGGMGRVWKALDEALERYVAIKALHQRHLENALMVRRFKREPLAMGRIRHQNVAQVLELEERPELVYFVMEYVDGRRLSDLITDEYRLPVAQAMNIFRQVADGLAEAHRRGIIHRDIKPGNVMVEAGGRAVLADFGLAKVDTWTSRGSNPLDPTAALREFDAQDTVHQGLVGTPAYLAPERWLGREYDCRMDIYSFGVMMFHTLTGELPFGEEADHALMTGHVKGKQKRVSSLAGPVPEMVERIVERCMQKSPERRFQDAEELHRALAFCEKDVEVGRSKVQKKLDALPLPPVEAGAEFLRKAVRLAGVFLVVALLLFTLFFLPLMALKLRVEVQQLKKANAAQKAVPAAQQTTEK